MELNVQGVAAMMKMLRAPLLKGPPPTKCKGIEREVPVEWLLEWLPDGSVVRVTFSLEHRSPPPLKQKNAWTYGISDNLPKRLQKPLSWNMVL